MITFPIPLIYLNFTLLTSESLNTTNFVKIESDRNWNLGQSIIGLYNYVVVKIYYFMKINTCTCIFSIKFSYIAIVDYMITPYLFFGALLATMLLKFSLLCVDPSFCSWEAMPLKFSVMLSSAALSWSPDNGWPFGRCLNLK